MRANGALTPFAPQRQLRHLQNSDSYATCKTADKNGINPQSRTNGGTLDRFAQCKSSSIAAVKTIINVLCIASLILPLTHSLPLNSYRVLFEEWQMYIILNTGQFLPFSFSVNALYIASLIPPLTQYLPLNSFRVLFKLFLSILNQMEFHLVQNRKENCHHDHIPFNVKGNGNIVFSVLSRALFKQ